MSEFFDVLAAANVALTSLLVFWPSNSDSTCASDQAVHRLEKSFEFAQTAAEDCIKRSSFSLFWVGFVCGFLVCTILATVISLVFRCLTRARRDSLGCQPASPSRALALPETPQVQVVEPANPNTLRLLGLAR